MKWLKNHKKITIITVVIILLLIIIVVSYSNGGSSSLIGRGIQQVLSVVQGPVSSAGNGTQNGLKGIFQFRTIVKENESLKEENAELKSEIIKIKLKQKELEELRELKNILNYEGLGDNQAIVTADVISMDGSNWFNIFTINVGTEKGVARDAIVMEGNKLIGRVMETGKGWSKVISIIDEQNSVSFKVQREKEEDLIGILKGDGKGGLSGYMLDSKAPIKEGDSLITTGIGLYPEGIEIGKVDKVAVNKDTLLKTITIEPSVKFKNIARVTVVLPNNVN